MITRETVSPIVLEINKIASKEFKMWLVGYSHSFNGGPPNDKQWTEIIRVLNCVQDVQCSCVLDVMKTKTNPNNESNNV